MKVLIFGGGAVGLGIASCLCESGISPDIICRPEGAFLLNTEGLIRTGIFGEGSYSNLRAFESIDAIADARAYTHILVCTKSYDSRTAAKTLASFPVIADSNTAIILCQNGWGNREVFADYFPEKQIFNARVITGFTRPAPNSTDITVHVEPVRMGSVIREDASVLEPLRQAIHDGGLDCELTDTIEKDLWAKMLFNCSLNPLGAIFRVPYGSLGDSPYSRSILEKVVQEIYRVMAAAGYSTWWETPEEYYALLQTKFIPATARHESSTLQDIKAGRRTEIDALTGAVIALGRKYSVDVPVNESLYNMIRFLETQTQ